MRPQVWHESLLLSRSLKGNLIYKFHQGCFVSRARMGLWSKQRVTKCIRCTGTVSYKLERSEVYMSQLDPLPRQNTWHSCVAETFPLFYWKIKIFTFLQGFCSLVEKQPHSFPPSIRHHSYCIWVIALPDWNSILWIWAAVYPVESCVHRRANTESTLREKKWRKEVLVAYNCASHIQAKYCCRPTTLSLNNSYMEFSKICQSQYEQKCQYIMWC